MRINGMKTATGMRDDLIAFRLCKEPSRLAACSHWHAAACLQICGSWIHTVDGLILPSMDNSIDGIPDFHIPKPKPAPRSSDSSQDDSSSAIIASRSCISLLCGLKPHKHIRLAVDCNQRNLESLGWGCPWLGTAEPSRRSSRHTRCIYDTNLAQGMVSHFSTGYACIYSLFSRK